MHPKYEPSGVDKNRFSCRINRHSSHDFESVHIVFSWWSNQFQFVIKIYFRRYECRLKMKTFHITRQIFTFIKLASKVSFPTKSSHAIIFTMFAMMLLILDCCSFNGAYRHSQDDDLKSVQNAVREVFAVLSGIGSMSTIIYHRLKLRTIFGVFQVPCDQCKYREEPMRI